jgi:hypothetical protein
MDAVRTYVWDIHLLIADNNDFVMSEVDVFTTYTDNLDGKIKEASLFLRPERNYSWFVEDSINLILL